MKTLKFEIIDHGCDGEQYFQGCDTSFTKFTDLTTGIGESAVDAAHDALGMMCEGFDYPFDIVDLTKAVDGLDATEIKRTYDECEASKCDGCEGCNNEWHHYVSIRYSIEGEES